MVKRFKSLVNSMDDIIFLTIAEVVEIHKDQVDRYGGHPGIRDNDLLCSAMSGAEATYGGQHLNTDLFEMAATYILYLCQDHPFIDGNNRTALAAGLVFLEVNRVSIIDKNGALYHAVMKMALGQLGKSEMTGILRGLVDN